jgi:hypothetical protein
MTGGASWPAGPPLPSGETGQPAVIIDGLGCLDEWDTLALARLPMTDLLRPVMRRLRGRAGRA